MLLPLKKYVLWPVLFLSPVVLLAQTGLLTTCDADLINQIRAQGQVDPQRQSNQGVIDFLEKAHSLCPGRSDLVLELAQAHVGARNFAQAIHAAEEYLAVYPESVPARLILAQAFFMTGRLSDTARETAAVLRARPNEPAALKIKANCAYLMGNFEEAKSTFISLLDSHPNDEDSAYMLGRMYYQEGYLEHAIGQFKRVLKINPKSYKAWDNLGLCYQALGANDDAIRYFLTAIKLVDKDHPEYDSPYANLADLLLRMGRPQQAYNAAAKATGRNPYSARDFYIGGKALDQLGKSDLALDWLRRSASLDPDYPEPWYLLTRLYKKMGDDGKSDEARRKFAEITARVPAKRR
jgi:tetratricopeptide (TPR) repeat protein